MAYIFGDCVPETESGQTERFYHADNLLLSAAASVIIGRC
jgi:hypothetical protein